MKRTGRRALILIFLFLFSGYLDAKVIVIIPYPVKPFFSVYEGVKSIIKPEDVLLFDFSKDAPEKILDIFNPVSDKIIVMGDECYTWAKLHFPHNKIFAFFVLAPDRETNGIYFFPNPRKISSTLRRIRPEVTRITLLLSKSTATDSLHQRVKNALSARGFSVKAINIISADENSFLDTLTDTVKKSDALITMPDSEVMAFPVYRLIARHALAESRPLFSLTKKHLDMGGAFWLSINYNQTGRFIGNLAINDTKGWFFAPSELKINKYILKKEHISYEKEQP